jgi:NADH/NAD ratio-sensing transcriptional regulator Rex
VEKTFRIWRLFRLVGPINAIHVAVISVPAMVASTTTKRLTTNVVNQVLNVS